MDGRTSALKFYALYSSAGNNHGMMCFMRLESDNSTLSWNRPQWSALRKNANAVPDYIFKSEVEMGGLYSRYSGSVSVIDDLEKGHIDLNIIKEVWLSFDFIDDAPTVNRLFLNYLTVPTVNIL